MTATPRRSALCLVLSGFLWSLSTEPAVAGNVTVTDVRELAGFCETYLQTYTDWIWTAMAPIVAENGPATGCGPLVSAERRVAAERAPHHVTPTRPQPRRQERLRHEPGDARVPLGVLLAAVARDDRLAPVVLLTVAVAGVDHQPRRQPGVAKGVQRLAHAARVVIRAALAATEDHVAVGIAARGDDAGQALLGDAEEAMGMGHGAQGIDRDLHATVSAVLEADRHRQRRGELAVHLALGGARTDRSPRDEVGDELRRDRVEELAAGR